MHPTVFFLSAKLCRKLAVCACCLPFFAFYLDSAAAEVITEDFQAYPLQSDTTGLFDPDDNETNYRITTTGNTGVSDPIVATVGEVLALSAGIEAEGANQYWTMGSAAGATGTISGQDGHVMIGDVGFLDGPALGGPFAAFFASPQDLTDSEISARLRMPTAAAPIQFRFLLQNAGDREIWTDPMSLTTAFQTFTVPVTAFTTLLDPQQGAFDFGQVISVGFEIFTTPGTAPALSVHVDDVMIDTAAGLVPETPLAKALPWLGLLLDN